MAKESNIELKYGCNPNQKPASIYVNNGALPFEVLNGKPGYINFMDAINSWQLVKEAKEALGIDVATSFKHVSPAGTALAQPIDDITKKIAQVEGDFSDIASAYIRARTSDRMSSFGDFIAVSGTVDESLASVISKEVSDGIIAPNYEPKALEILKNKRRGSYNIVKMDYDYDFTGIEQKKIYGITFEQNRNTFIPDDSVFQNIVTEKKDLSEDVKRDMILSLINLKYTQSNSVCYTYNGQVVGCGAGQQSRIHCTRLAGSKVDIWWLRHHERVQNLKFVDGLSRAEKDNAIDQFLSNDITDEEKLAWANVFKEIPRELTKEEKADWMSKLTGVTLGSDAFFPFSDNIDRANKSGVSYVIQPGGSVRDDAVIEACDKYGMVMAFTGIRLFHH